MEILSGEIRVRLKSYTPSHPRVFPDENMSIEPFLLQFERDLLSMAVRRHP